MPSGRRTDITKDIIIGEWVGSKACYFLAIGEYLIFHSDYKGFKIYRQYNPLKGRPMMSYYGIQWVNPNDIRADSEYRTSVHAKNLDGIKKAISGAKI